MPSDSEVMSLLVGNSLYITCRYEYFFIIIAMKSIYKFPKAAFNLFEVMLVFVGIGCILGLLLFSPVQVQAGFFQVLNLEPNFRFISGKVPNLNPGSGSVLSSEPKLLPYKARVQAILPC